MPIKDECGWITGTTGHLVRCLRPVMHRGPHYQDTEPVTCNCEYICMGHDADQA